MRFFLITVASASALAPRTRLETASSPVSAAAVSRRSLSSFIGAAAASVAAGASAYEGVYSMEVVSAKEAVLDRGALNDGRVKKALDEFKYYATGVVQVRDALEKNDQFNVGGLFAKEYDFVKVRATFNNLEALWDEETQRGVDRAMRSVLQGITEVQAAAKYNDEGVRTPKRLAATKQKLEKLDGDFRKLFAYLISDAQ